MNENDDRRRAETGLHPRLIFVDRKTKSIAICFPRNSCRMRAVASCLKCGRISGDLFIA